jgi:predicted phosphodiesterase
MLVGILGAWVAVLMWHGATTHFAGMTVRAAFTPARSGATVMHLPPFGVISARTHRAPLRLDVEVEQVRVEEAARWIRQHPDRQEVIASAKAEMRRVAMRLVKVTLIAALLGALAASLLLFAGGRLAAVGVVSGFLSVAVPLAALASTYQVSALSKPTFRGELSRAPMLLNVAGNAWRDYSDLVRDLPKITRAVVGLYGQLGQAAPLEATDAGEDWRVLLISDLHNNPLGVRVGVDLAKSYDVRLVLVAGDITDMGSPLETKLTSTWREFAAPVVMITGNHDSEAVVRACAALPGVTVLDNGEVVTRAGLTIMGFGDPAARRAGVGRVDPTRAELKDLTARVIDRLEAGPLPDLLMIHNHHAAAQLAGHAPLIVCGHSHRALIRETKGSLIVNDGTTGAAGLRYLTGPKRPPYGAVVFHFGKQDGKPVLRAVDAIAMQLPSGDFTATRQTMTPPLALP